MRTVNGIFVLPLQWNTESCNHIAGSLAVSSNHTSIELYNTYINEWRLHTPYTVQRTAYSRSGSPRAGRVMILMACMCFCFRAPPPGPNRMPSPVNIITTIAYHGLTLQLPINISLNLISNYAVVLFTTYLVVGYVTVIMKGGVGKNGSTVAVRLFQLALCRMNNT